MNQVGLFNPFVSRAEGEDPLTWAFLSGLKYDPLLRVFLRDLVQTRLPSAFTPAGTPWEPAHVSMHGRRIEPPPTCLVSVVLTGEPTYEEIRVGWSDRERRYDGVVAYADGWTLIITNKLRHGGAWKDQSRPSRSLIPDGIDDVRLYDWAVCLQWPEILGGVLLRTRSALLPLGNRELAEDLLSFVEEMYPALTPYRTFELCGGRQEALEWRTCRLVRDIANLSGVECDGAHLYRPGRIARRISFTLLAAEEEPWQLSASLRAAGTAAEANAFHDALLAGSGRAGFLCLDGYDGWHVEPTLNFSFMGRKLVWADSPCGLAVYLGHFFSDVRPYGRRRRDEWAALIREWEQVGIIAPQDGDRIQEILGDRPFMDVNPEFLVYRDWECDTVIALEKEGRLSARVRDALATPLGAWGETLGDA